MDTTNPTSTSSLPPGNKLEITKHHASEIAISKAAYDSRSSAQRPPEYQDTDDMIHHQDIASVRDTFEITAAVSESDRGGHGRVASSSSTSTNLFHRHQPEYHSSNFAAYSHFHHHHHHYAGGYAVSSVPPVNYYEMGLQDLDSGSANNGNAIRQEAGGDTYSSTGDLMPLAMAAAAAESHEATLSSFSKNLSSRRDGFALKTVATKDHATKEKDASEKSGDARKRFLERNRVAGKLEALSGHIYCITISLFQCIY